ncbi:tannase-domain-containing protein, partial [Glonium stellatum]
LVHTVCENGNCIGVPFRVAADQVQLFLKKDPDFDVRSIMRKDFDQIFHASVQQFSSIIRTDDPDLSQFREAGGKLITWHGLADQLIFPNSTRQYYDRVLDVDANVREYFRYFEAPGVAHCFGGPGGPPVDAFERLIRWVEQLEAPEILNTASPRNKDGIVSHQPLCTYPSLARFKGKVFRIAGCAAKNYLARP